MNMRKIFQTAALLLTVSVLLLSFGGCQPADPGSSPDSGTDPQKNAVLGETCIGYGPKAETPSFAASADNVADLAAQGVKKDGQADDAEAFRKAIDAVKGKGYIYLEAGRYRIGSDLTVPEDMVLAFNRGARLVIDSGATLTINGFVEAGRYQIFDGDGTVSGSIRSAGYPHWFGDLSGSDDTAAMQKAVDACRYVQLPAGTNYDFGTIHLRKPVTVTGTGAYDVAVNFSSKADVLFSIESDNVTLQYLTPNAGKGAGATTILFNNADKDLSGITLYRIRTAGVGRMIDTASDAHHVTKAEMVKVFVDSSRDTGVHLVNFKNDITLDDVLVSDLGTPGKVDFPLFLFENCEGMYFINTDAAGGATKGTGGDGFYFKNCKKVEVGRSMVDYTNGFGLVLDNCSDMVLNHWINSLCEKGCLCIKDSRDIEFHITNANGNGTKPGVKDYDAAIVVESSSNILFNSAFIQSHCGDGLRIKDSDHITVNDAIITNMAGGGYVEEGTSDNNTIKGLTITNVSGTAFQQVGAHSVTYALICGDKVMEAKVEGAATR
ncbi:MAG: right-handed parallel beta-helix repeat-containing protein [Clostridia bacterium]|nr:right-handed parallel beta-helix repeat-containing protein [Clostridia bacterium]